MAVDWYLWRKCAICKAAIGEPCQSLSGKVVDGQPDGVRTDLEQPHKARVGRVSR